MKRLSAAAVLLILPFMVAMVLNIVRGDPSRLAARDDTDRDLQLGYLPGEVTFDYTREPGLLNAAKSTASFMLGLKWHIRVGRQPVGRHLAKYAWLVSGVGAWGKRFAPDGQTDVMLRGGTSLGLTGIMMAGLGALLWRRERGWVLLGLGLFLGNLLFILLYDAWDSLTFTIPGLIGLSLLAGLGAAGPPSGSKGSNWRGWGITCLIATLAVIPINIFHVSHNTAKERAQIAQRDWMARLDWPRDAVILTTYWPAMTYRYVLWIQANRPDISVIHTERGKHLPLAAHYLERGRPLYLTAGIVPPALGRALQTRTDPDFAVLGFLRMDPTLLGIPPSSGRR